jgi:hypothetical protein
MMLIGMESERRQSLNIKAAGTFQRMYHEGHSHKKSDTILKQKS